MHNQNGHKVTEIHTIAQSCEESRLRLLPLFAYYILPACKQNEGSKFDVLRKLSKRNPSIDLVIARSSSLVDLSHKDI